MRLVLFKRCERGGVDSGDSSNSRRTVIDGWSSQGMGVETPLVPVGRQGVASLGLFIQKDCSILTHKSKVLVCTGEHQKGMEGEEDRWLD